MMKKTSLTISIWKYLVLFSILILFFLWIFQILFLNKFYEREKKKDLIEIALKIKKSTSKQQLLDIMNDSAYNKNICVEITTKNETLYSSEYLSRGCLKGNEENVHYKEDFIYQNYQKMIYQITNPTFQNKTLVYGLKMNHNLYAFINTSIEPIDSTTAILKKQLLYVTILVLVLSFIIAYFISQKISKPIVKIGKNAKKLAKKEFQVTFEEEEILELNELSHTLNETKKELEQTEELRRDLMANISHDLKTPLTMIKAYAELARDLNQNKKQKRQKNLDIIIEETDRLTNLVNDILTLSKVESKIEVLNQSEVNLHKLIQSILKRYEILKETEDYQFIYKNKKNIIVKADQKKLEQVLYNLLNNAINYTGEDKKIMIHLLDKKNKIRVEIEDTGKGIKKEDLPHIWDRYYKNKKKHKRNLVGTGLGLAIVKQILELHHYQYGVISKKTGTIFYFEIKKED